VTHIRSIRPGESALAILDAADHSRPAPDPVALPHRVSSTFTNPIVQRGQDPHVVRHDGYYYLIMSEDDRRVTIRRSPRLTTLGAAPPVVVWEAAPHGDACAEVWAPELFLVDGRWYIYVAASNGVNATHRMYVLESAGRDPLGPYHERGKIAAATDKWAIDGSVIQRGDDHYFVWSGWPGDHNVRQNLYIAPMSDPWTLRGDRVLLSEPDAPWEIPTARPAMHEGCIPAVNEGPAALHRHGRVFLVFSANGSWSDDYCLGMLVNESGNLLNRNAWTKSAGPVFAKNPAAGVHGPGHNSFIQSPDGREDWIVYHANLAPGGGWRKRTVLAQSFSWRPDGTPHFGAPLPPGAALPIPSGEDRYGPSVSPQDLSLVA